MGHIFAETGSHVENRNRPCAPMEQTICSDPKQAGAPIWGRPPIHALMRATSPENSAPGPVEPVFDNDFDRRPEARRRCVVFREALTLNAVDHRKRAQNVLGGRRDAMEPRPDQ